MKSLLSFRPLYAVALASATLVLAGCGDAIEDNPLFKDQQKIVAQLDDDNKAMGRQIEDVAMTLETIKQVVNEIKHSPNGSLEGMKEIDRRLRAVETSMAEVEATVKEKIMSLAKLEIELQDKVKSTKSVAAAAPVQTSSSSSSEVKTVQARVTRTSSEPAPEPVKPRGSYYKVQSGDTPETVASAHKIGVPELLAANRIPQGGQLIAGQQIYVPAAK